MMPRVAGSEGSYIPISAGVALASKLRGKDNVVVAGCGDGSTGLGDFHEGLNLAAVLDLPLVLVSVNNQVYMHVPIKSYLRTGDVAGMASSYGIPGVAVDGNDLFAVRRAVKDAVTRARAGDGPTLVECRTFRMGGHWEPNPVDPETYLPGWNSDVEVWKARDPLGLVERVLLERRLCSEKQIATMHTDVTAEFNKAYATVEAMPAMDAEEVVKMESHMFGDGG
jgi:TPP-dependent pyruvate/acetoin dehydrogenase alpha subunit